MKAKIETFELRNKETGEFWDVAAIKRKGKGNSWMKLWQEWLEDCPSLRKETYRVLLRLMGIVKWGNILPSPPLLAKEALIHENAAYRAYNELIKVGIVIKKDRVYYLSPKIGWKGDETGYNIARRELLSIVTSVKVLPPQGLLPPSSM